MPSPRPCNVSRVLSPHPSCIYFSWAAIDSGEPNRPSRHSSPCPADAAGVVATPRATARALASKRFWRVQQGAAAPIGPGGGRLARRGTRRGVAAVSERGFCRCASAAQSRLKAQRSRRAGARERRPARRRRRRTSRGFGARASGLTLRAGPQPGGAPGLGSRQFGHENGVHFPGL